MINEKNKIIIEIATLDDCPLLAEMNRKLIDEEQQGRQQGNTMTVSELDNRMREWFQKGVYTGYLIRLNDEIIGYALIDCSEMWMRHFFVSPDYRRQSYGRKAMELLFEQLGVEEIGLSCLTNNVPGLAFWRSFEHDAYSIKFNIRKPNTES